MDEIYNLVSLKLNYVIRMHGGGSYQHNTDKLDNQLPSHMQPRHTIWWRRPDMDAVDRSVQDGTIYRSMLEQAAALETEGLACMHHTYCYCCSTVECGVLQWQGNMGCSSFSELLLTSRAKKKKKNYCWGCCHRRGSAGRSPRERDVKTTLYDGIETGRDRAAGAALLPKATPCRWVKEIMIERGSFNLFKTWTYE